MIHVSATEAKNDFGKLLATARTENVSIEEKGEPVAVILSQKEFQILSDIEDALWVLAAKEAKKEGMLGIEESEKFLKKMREELRNAKD